MTFFVKLNNSDLSVDEELFGKVQSYSKIINRTTCSPLQSLKDGAIEVNGIRQAVNLAFL